MKIKNILKLILIASLALSILFLGSCQILDSLKKQDKKEEEDKTVLAEQRGSFDDITVAYFGESKEKVIDLDRKVKKNGTEVTYEVSSSNKSIVGVSEKDGELTVTVKGVGKATVTVDVFSDEKEAFSAEFEVTSKKYTKIACIGDSLTYGHTWTDEAYPVYLSELFAELDSDIEVKNFGVNGASLTGIKPQNSALTKYEDSAKYDESIDYNPDIVVILLGTNDVNGWELGAKEVFVDRYYDLIATYTNKNPDAKVVVVTPPTVEEGNSLNKHKGMIDEEIYPAVLSGAMGDYCVDFHAFVESFSGEKFREDGVHLSAALANELAKLVYDAIVSI